MMLGAVVLSVSCAPAPEPASESAERLAGVPAAGLPASSPQSEITSIDPPAERGALAPNLAVVAGRLAATWLEPVIESGVSLHRLRFARFDAGDWSAPISIAQGPDFFANWADFPSLVEASDGTLYAHWLAKTAADTYAYSIFLARSDDQGATWRELGQLNSDHTPTEHGFVALVPADDGATAFWLDGREMVGGAPMTLRSASIEARRESVLDLRVCECCGTDAAWTQDGPLVVYRDRSEDEVRDISVVRMTSAGWSEPEAVYADGWRINGCPVNGPAVDAIGGQVAVAWYTAAEQKPRVQIAFSEDSGASFSEPIVVDDGPVLGRVDLTLDVQGEAWLSWVSSRDKLAEVWVQQVRPEGVFGPRRFVARTSAGRASGFPILERAEGELFIAWVDVGSEPEDSQIRIGQL